ncbi:MAG: hypothetical protein MUE38_11890 [Flavihumibacter sp.]|jgi:hypothetical protein|nr:hypothetical protein [Flavihumibacter sp.]
MMVVNYYTNKQEFLANCENKSRPELACEGKCILMKKIKAAEQKEEQEKKESKGSGSADILSSRSFFTNELNLTKKISAQDYSLHVVSNTIDQSYPLFHPPC